MISVITMSGFENLIRGNIKPLNTIFKNALKSSVKSINITHRLSGVVDLKNAELVIKGNEITAHNTGIGNFSKMCFSFDKFNNDYKLEYVIDSPNPDEAIALMRVLKNMGLTVSAKI